MGLCYINLKGYMIWFENWTHRLKGIYWNRDHQTCSSVNFWRLLMLFCFTLHFYWRYTYIIFYLTAILYPKGVILFSAISRSLSVSEAQAQPSLKWTMSPLTPNGGVLPCLGSQRIPLQSHSRGNKLTQTTPSSLSYHFQPSDPLSSHHVHEETPQVKSSWPDQRPLMGQELAWRGDQSSFSLFYFTLPLINSVVIVMSSKLSGCQ